MLNQLTGDCNRYTLKSS